MGGTPTAARLPAWALPSGLRRCGSPRLCHAPPLQTLSPGCKLWGAVIEVSPRELVVSLPHGLRGHVAYSEASDWLAEQAKKADKAVKAAGGEEASGRKRKAGVGTAAGAGALPPLTELFGIGQLVRCTVTALRDGEQGSDAAEGSKKKGKKGEGERKQRKRVDVSLRLSKLCAGLGEYRSAGRHGRAVALASTAARLVCAARRLMPRQRASNPSFVPAGGRLERPPPQRMQPSDLPSVRVSVPGSTARRSACPLACVLQGPRRYGRGWHCRPACAAWKTTATCCLLASRRAGWPLVWE